MPTLIKDVYSHFKTSDKKDFIKYASKGQQVEIISDRGTALILEITKTGFRFPAKRDVVL